jgi:hypothetical protein
MKLRRAWNNPNTHAKYHLFSTFFWGILLIPSVTIWKESLVWVIFMSWYALVTGHFSAYEATRSEIISKREIEGDFKDLRDGESLEDFLERKEEASA